VSGMDHGMAAPSGRRLAQARMLDFMAEGSTRLSPAAANDTGTTGDAALA
jgi:hypothetical protein